MGFLFAVLELERSCNPVNRCTSTWWPRLTRRWSSTASIPIFPTESTASLRRFRRLPLPPSSQSSAAEFKDLRSLLWSSIDNDTSKDLDQIEWAEQLPDGRIRVLVGVADVDVRVAKGTVIDTHARSETTSVYTGVKVFPMLPPELSEGITFAQRG